MAGKKHCTIGLLLLAVAAPIMCELIELEVGATSNSIFTYQNISDKDFPVVYLTDNFLLISDLVLTNESNQNCSLNLEHPISISFDESKNISVSSNEDNSEHTFSSVLTGSGEVILTTYHSWNESLSSSNHSVIVAVPFVITYPSEDPNVLLQVYVNVSCWSSGESSNWQSKKMEFFYGGPDVGVSTEDEDGGAVTPDMEETAAVSIILPGNWEMTETVLSLALSSETVNSLDVTFKQCLLLVHNSDDVLTTHPQYVNITDFSVVNGSTGITITEQEAAKRSAGDNVILSWYLGNITNTGNITNEIEFLVTFVVDDNNEFAAGDILDMNIQLYINDVSVELDQYSFLVKIPQLILSSSVQVLNSYDYDSTEVEQRQQFRIEVSVLNQNVSTGATAYNLILLTTREAFKIDYQKNFIPDVNSEDIDVSNNAIELRQDVLQLGEEMIISYEGYFTDSFISSQQSDKTVDNTVTWDIVASGAVNPAISYMLTEQSICLAKSFSQEADITVTNYFHLIWIFLIALAVGFVLLLIVYLLSRKGPYSTVQPMGDGWGGAPSRGYNSSYAGWQFKYDLLESMGQHAQSESVVYYLTQKDEKLRYMELGNIDVVVTISMDMQVEDLRFKSMTESFQLLLEKFGSSTLITRSLLQKVYKKISRETKDELKKLEDTYRNELHLLQMKHQHEMQAKQYQLKKKHDIIWERAKQQTKHMDPKESKEVLDLLDKQREAEVTEVMQLLQLSQGEQSESLRKEFDVKKRIAVKKLQQGSLDQIILEGNLDEDGARYLLSEYHDMSRSLDGFVDEEISKQRMLLEETSEKKKSFAEEKNAEDAWNKQILNTVASQTLEVISELERSDQLTEEQSKQYMEKMRKDLQAVKEKYELERAHQQAALHKKLSQMKRERLAAKEKEQAEIMMKFENEEHSKLKQNEQEPQVYIESKLTLMSSQMAESKRLANEIDKETSEELMKLETDLAEKTKKEMEKQKQNLCSQLTQNHGLTERMKNEILEQHERDLEKLEEEREEARMKQQKDIKNRLAKVKKDLANRKQEEKEEKEQLRHYKENMVNKLLASQVAVSEEERKKLLEEYEKNLIAAENSLSLSKLRQQRLVEEKVAKMRARQMEKVEKKHLAETKRQMRSHQLEEDEDDEEAHEKNLGELMKKQAEEKLNLMNTVTMDIDDDLEAVRVEMLQERALALQKQEEKLGMMMAQLQLDKAREMATIEEQQKALLQLKMNMFDEMTEKGVIKNSQATKVIDAHQKGVVTLEKKVNAQREKQEEALKSRLREKMMERERSLAAKQESELRELSEKYSNSTVVRLKRVALKHKHMQQQEQLRNKFELEVTQTLEEVRRQFEMDRMKKLQEQELEFLAALAKVGGYSEQEMKNVLRLLFPAKGSEEITSMMKEMFDNSDGKQTKEKEDNHTDEKKSPIRMLFGLKKGSRNSSEGESLEEKVKKAIMASQSGNSSEKDKDKRRSSLAKLMKKGRLTPLSKGDNEKATSGSSLRPGTLPEIQPQERPEPLGRASRQVHSDEEEDEEEDEDEEDEIDSDHSRGRSQRPSDFTL